MRSTVSEIRRALAAQLDSHFGGVLTVYEQVPSQPIVPSLTIYPPESIAYRATRRLDVMIVPLLALVGPIDPTAQEVLEALMSGSGDLSILAVLYEDRTLDGTVTNLRLLDMTSGAYSFTSGAQDNVVGAEFRIEVTA